MYAGKLVFAQVMDHMPVHTFKTQVRIAISVYVLVAILKKRLDLDASLYTILQVLSVTAFEKAPLQQLFSETEITQDDDPPHNQLNLFD